MPRKSPPRRGQRSKGAWDLKHIQELIDVLTEREITEFEMERGGLKIHIKRGNANPGSFAPMDHSATPSFDRAPLSPPPAMAPVEPSEADSAEGLYIIKSPIVGTFYASRAPNAPPFVNEGDVVEVGQVLCIVEAMKLMNEIESEVAGEIVRVYVENGQPVEYGQSLFAVKPSHKK